MPLQLEDGKSFAELIQQCEAHLFSNRVTANFLGTPIEYVPNNIIDELGTTQNISKLLAADTSLQATRYRNQLAACAEEIHSKGKKLLATTIKSGMSSPLEFVLDMLAGSADDKMLPFDPMMHAIAVPRAVPAQHVGKFNALFMPAQRKVLAPTFRAMEYDHRLASISVLPLLSVKPVDDYVGEPEFTVLFHPAHLIDGFTPNREMQMKVFTDPGNVRLFRNKVTIYFGFRCEGKYYCVY
tara:strand:- start:28763 stop:29482 length:720 start_codon:yes stop_codon:yes gene_type:complete